MATILQYSFDILWYIGEKGKVVNIFQLYSMFKKSLEAGFVFIQFCFYASASTHALP